MHTLLLPETLEVYQRTYTDGGVLVCLDETSKQHIKETCAPLPMRQGNNEIYDFEYERNGVSHLIMLFAPLKACRSD